MYLVLIAWFYVVLMFAVAQNDLAHMLIDLLFLGVLPIWAVVWIVHRRRVGKAGLPEDGGA